MSKCETCARKQYGYLCDGCIHDPDNKDLYEPMTNADRIRAMNDEELALWICGIYDIEEEHEKFINGIIIPGYAPHDIEEWLHQPAEEDDHDERKENENARR